MGLLGLGSGSARGACAVPGVEPGREPNPGTVPSAPDAVLLSGASGGGFCRPRDAQQSAGTEPDFHRPPGLLLEAQTAP